MSITELRATIHWGRMSAPTSWGVGGWGLEVGAVALSRGDESGPDFTADHLVHANDCKVSELGVIED